MSGPPDTDSAPKVVAWGRHTDDKETPVADKFEGEAYCVKCKAKRPVKDGHIEVNEKGRRMAKGTCSECGTKVTVFLKAA